MSRREQTDVRVLVVEDEPFIAMDLELLARAAGHVVVGVAEDSLEAVRLGRGADLALVDLNLRDGLTGLAVSRALSEAGLAVGFVTGNAEQIPPDFAGAVGAVEKPFTEAGIGELLDRLRAARDGETASPARYVLLPSS